MLRGRAQQETLQQPTPSGSHRPGKAAMQLPLLLARVAPLCLAPSLALLLGAEWRQLLVCAAVGGIWAALEVGVAMRTPCSAGFRTIHYGLRVAAALLLSVSGCWLLASPGSSESLSAPAPGQRVLPTREFAEGLASQQPMKSPPFPDSISTLSVVVPCANESEFVARTVSAIFEATPPDQLLEIVVIDDASQPPISQELATGFLQAHRATVHRHDEPQGLIRSKIHGAEASTGDVIVFLDCHVKPMEAWSEPILANLRENPRRVVVPYITSLNPDTWEEVSPMGGGKKMCLTWNADFVWCNEYPGPYVPVMSGGLLAISRFWWDTIGGYDEHMLAWGGENLDQSLRTWLCGGEILVAEGSRVAHMWRDPSKPKTQLRYSIPTDCVRRNRLRAVEAWFGPWAEKVRTFPEFEDFREGGLLDIGSLDNVKRYRDRLQCKGFEEYLHRFQDLYIGTGRLPSSVFHIQEAQSGLCMELEGAQQDVTDESGSGRIILAPCHRDSELQRFHEANAKSGTSECCSGLKVWDFSQCIASYELDGVLNADTCEMGGDTPGQHLRFTDDAQIKWEPGEGIAEDGCLMPKEARRSPAMPGAFLIGGMECSAKVAFADDDHGVRRFRVVSGDHCLSSGPAEEYGEQLLFVPCEEGGEDLIFALAHTYEDGQFQVITNRGLCVDAKHGLGPLITWPCDGVSAGNLNQIFAVEDSAALIWRLEGELGDSHCIDAMEQVFLASCHNPLDGPLPLGQTWHKQNLHEDGSFELHQGNTGSCLGFKAQEHRQGEPEKYSLYRVPCRSSPHLRWENDEGRLRNLALDMCIDANDMASPILFACYDFGDPPLLQRFEVNDSGLVYTPRTWGDNGRTRYPARCLDGRPEPPVDVTTRSCEEVQRSGVTWRKLWPETPLETRLFLEAGGGLANA